MSLVKAMEGTSCLSNDTLTSFSPARETTPHAALVGKFSFLIGDTALADTRLVIVASSSCNKPPQVGMWQYGST